jgi:hypothetical protein
MRGESVDTLWCKCHAPDLFVIPVVDLVVFSLLGLTDLFVVGCLVYDRTTRGRVHPAFW